MAYMSELALCDSKSNFFSSLIHTSSKADMFASTVFPYFMLCLCKDDERMVGKVEAIRM